MSGDFDIEEESSPCRQFFLRALMIALLARLRQIFRLKTWHHFLRNKWTATCSEHVDGTTRAVLLYFILFFALLCYLYWKTPPEQNSEASFWSELSL